MEKPAAPRAVVFDAYGTLFDVYSVGLVAEQLFPGQGQALGVLWRDKQIEYTRLTSMSDRYRPFWELTRAGLRFAAQRLALPLNAAAEDKLMNQYRHLSAFPENTDVLRELKSRGIPTAILSNGDPEMLAVAVKSAGFTPYLDHVLSVDAVRKYKTDPAAYALGPQAL
ncbi:MAG: haloacid dehalogenase type II, partial [Betaproteobacteria bacterium]